LKSYGKELILDLHKCDSSRFNRRDIEGYLNLLVAKLDMQACDLHWWDDVGVPEAEQQTEPHLKGTSAVQFIMTSSIVIHTLELMGNAYINIFSCKEFDAAMALEFSEEWFDGQAANSHVIDRI